MSLILLADIGGTNSRLVLARRGEGLLHDTLAVFQNDRAGSAEKLVSQYMAAQGHPACSLAILAVAAPIGEAEITLTNRDWRLTREGIGAASRASEVHFINDFEALGYGLTDIGHEQAQHVCGPVFEAGANEANKMVVGAGTGFNAATLKMLRGGDYLVGTAECGHMMLGVENAEELSLRDTLAKNRGRASVERALSGRGICEIYQWVCHRNGRHSELQTNREISSQALADPMGMAAQAMQMLTRIYARTVGDLALAFLPLGGIFLSGSVTRAAAPWITQQEFADTFAAKGRQTDLMQRFPIYLLKDDRAALHGCFAVAQVLLDRPTKQVC